MAFLTHDLFAGLTLAAIAIPEQMATARLGGFTPQLGFFAFLAGSLAFAAFGSNRFLSCGADSTITPIFAGGLAVLVAAGSPDYPVMAAALALMVGVLLLAAGIFRLGWIADLLSIPVTTGFLAGISGHILISQLPVVLGLPSPSGAMLQRLATLAGQLNEANAFTLLIGLGVLAIIAVSERIDARIPGALIGLALASASVALLGLESRGVSVLGAVSVALPSPAIPVISAGHLASLLSLSLIIAVVVMVQTAATTRSFLSDPDQPADVDRDFVGVGVGSILSGLIGAFPVNASPPRTAVVCETGGRSQLAGLAAAAIVVALLAFGAALLSRIPNAALGGVLLFVALRIVRVGQIVAIYRQSRGEFLLIVATAALGVLNTVMVELRDRIRELGTYRAIGMTPKQTMTMVLTSTVAVGLLAAVIGVPAGIALHDYVVPVMGHAAGTNLPTADVNVFRVGEEILLGLAGVAIAVLAALLPAGWAARIRTSTALRTE